MKGASPKRNDILTYNEMCMIEGSSLQRGMNYRLGGRQSIFLMSVRSNAPYNDLIDENGRVLIYEGHDVARNATSKHPKEVDQPETLVSGTLTENGKFYLAAQSFKAGKSPPEPIRVYQKLHPGVWAFNGTYLLVDSWRESDDIRRVFKFRLELVDEELRALTDQELSHSRLIPASVKAEVFKRDRGQCVICGKTDNLHFDHNLPFSKGGTSLLAENVQLLCARHNLEKSNKIE